MSETISASSVVPNSSYLPRVGTYDSRAIELALAGSTLFERGVRLEGALVEASFANREPPLLKRLREDEVPFLVDVQALRFATDAYLDIEAVAGLPFSPDAALTPTSTTPDVEKRLAHEALIFQQRMGARRYVAPALPLLDAELPAWLDINTRLLSHASNANGGSSVDRRPLLAMVAPARKALANPNLIVPRLLDSPIDGVYVQSLNLRPTRDSVEKLAQYVKFLAKLKETGLPVVAGRVGAFGLLLQALDVVDAFDSGLGQAEGYSWASSVRPRRPRDSRTEGTHGGDRRVYFSALKTTLPSRFVTPIISQPGLRGRLTCTLGCCEMRGFEDLIQRGRPHYLWTRHAEVDALRAKPTRTSKLSHVYEELVSARENARVVERLFRAHSISPPDLSHLERWIALLSRESELLAVA